MIRLYKVMPKFSTMTVSIHTSTRIIPVLFALYSCQYYDFLHFVWSCWCTPGTYPTWSYILYFAYIWFWFASILFRTFASVLMSNFLSCTILTGFDRMNWVVFYLSASLWKTLDWYYLVEFAYKIMNEVGFFFFLGKLLNYSLGYIYKI